MSADCGVKQMIKLACLSWTAHGCVWCATTNITGICGGPAPQLSFEISGKVFGTQLAIDSPSAFTPRYRYVEKTIPAQVL